MIGVYMIKNKVNGKYYVGSSVNIESRWQQHIKSLDEGNHTNKHLQNAWNKYGKSNFDFLVLEETSLQNLRDRETYYLQIFDCTKKGYNLIDNANIGLGVSASSEIRKKISEACSGNRNGNYGRKRSKEEIQMIRDRRWGTNYVCKKDRPECKPRKKTSEELAESRKRAGEKIRQAKLGTHLSEVTKQKLREYRTGKKWSAEVKKHFSETRKGANNSNCKLTREEVLEIYDKMNRGIHYKQVCEEYGISQCQAYKIKRKEHWVFNDL